MIRKIVFAALGLWLPFAQAQDVTLRHRLEGQTLAALASLVVEFNGEQKGKGRIVLQDLKGVSERQHSPELAILDPDDSQEFFGTSPRFYPLHKIMDASRLKLDARQFYPQMAAAVDDLTGKIQALPLAQALPVLFYNRDAFIRAGLDPDNPPRTWWELQTAAGKLFDAGYKCPLTSSRFAWIHLDNLSSQHGEPAMVREGKIDRVAFNTLVHVKHIALLASWQKSYYFHYFGPGLEGDAKFMSGECSMLTGESPLYRELQQASGFRFGVAELPYYDDVRGARPTDVLPDGAALWALPGKTKEQYAVIARFVDYLLKPDKQRAWVQATGFLPMTPAAVDALKAAGAPRSLLERAAQRLSVIPAASQRTKNGSGRSRIRGILNEEIAFVWGDKKPAKEALDSAMARANATLQPPPPMLARPGKR